MPAFVLSFVLFVGCEIDTCVDEFMSELIDASHVVTGVIEGEVGACALDVLNEDSILHGVILGRQNCPESDAELEMRALILTSHDIYTT